MLHLHDPAPLGAPSSVAPAARPPQNGIAALLSPDDILLGVEATTRDGVFARIAQWAAARGLREDAVLAGLTERERLGSTALGHGVAIPHARLEGLTRAMVAFVRPRWAVPFDAPDDKPVSALFVLLVPTHATNQHLALLAQIAALFCDKAFRDRVQDCATVAEVLDAFALGRPT